MAILGEVYFIEKYYILLNLELHMKIEKIHNPQKKLA